MKEKTGSDFNLFLDQDYYNMWGVNTKEKMFFYYDESNNCRKFWLDSNKDDFNNDPNADFVLAGVACDNEVQIPFDELQLRFKLQKNVTELKAKSLFKGKDFLACMGTKTVSSLFSLINEYNLFIHYVHVNNFFYTIVEILDSITNPKEIMEYGFDYFQLKTTLFNMLHSKIKNVSEIMIRYAYPNISKENIKGFCTDLCNLLGPKYEMKPDEKFVYGALRRAAHGDKLLFIQDNPEYILQDDYSMFYVNRIMTFPLSQHCFDEELSIQSTIENHVKRFSGNDIKNNYCFVKSESNTMVQVSDLVAGLFGRMFSFFNLHKEDEFATIVSELTNDQLSNLCELQRLRVKSDYRNKGLLHSVTAIGMILKIDVFFNYVITELRKRK